MEQKRTLWILISSGFFLLFVFGAALIFYASDANRNTSALSQRDTGNVWMSPNYSKKENAQSLDENLRNFLQDDSAVSQLDNENDDQEFPNDKNFETQDFGNSQNLAQTKVYNEGTTTIDLNNLNSFEVPSNVTPQNKAAENAIRKTKENLKNTRLQENVTPKVTSNPITVTQFVQKSESPKIATTDLKQNAPSSAKNETTNSTSKKSAPKKVVAPAKNVIAKIPDRFWVQAASYSSKQSADEARTILDANKIQCEVFTYNDARGLHYRVRVGPYTTKSEAEYWQKKIETIPMFSKNGTYITNSSAALASK